MKVTKSSHYAQVMLVVAALAQGVLAQSGAEGKIKQAYYKATKGAELKFLDGQLSMRHKDFRLTDQDGHAVDLRMERIRLGKLYAMALEVKETASVRSLQIVGGTRARCKVQYHTEFFVVENPTAKPALLTMDSECEDEWTLTPKGWKQSSSHITQQRLKRAKSL